MKPGAILLIKFPFTDLASIKKRPALLLHTNRLTENIQTVTVAMITSKVEGFKMEGDVILADWKHAHLLHPSLVRLAKIATIESDLIDHPLGELSVRDVKSVKRAFRRLYRFWC